MVARMTDGYGDAGQAEGAAGAAGGMAGSDDVARREAGADETRRANRAWGDQETPDYLAEHGALLGEARVVWGPEGVAEPGAGRLGAAPGRRGGRGGPARRRPRPGGAGDRLRGCPVLALAADRRRRPRRARPVRGHAAARSGRRRGRRPRGTAGVRGCHGPALRGRGVRPGVLGLRGAAVPRRLGPGDAGGGPGAAARRAVGVLVDGHL